MDNLHKFRNASLDELTAVVAAADAMLCTGITKVDEISAYIEALKQCLANCPGTKVHADSACAAVPRS